MDFFLHKGEMSRVMFFFVVVVVVVVFFFFPFVGLDEGQVGKFLVI